MEHFFIHNNNWKANGEILGQMMCLQSCKIVIGLCSKQLPAGYKMLQVYVIDTTLFVCFMPLLDYGYLKL